MDVLFRYYPFIERRGGLFLDIGAGAAYTSVAFHEQRTHLLGILIGGIGFRYNNFFVTDRLKHYSNGGTAAPNRSVNSNVISVGMYF
jgi:hypothetical protein